MSLRSEVVPGTERVSAVADDALGSDDAVGLAARLRRGEVSADEVRAAAAERVARVDPVLRGLCLDRFDEPVAGAADGPLAGVPAVVKENTDVAGWPTTNGSSAYVAAPAPAHSEVTQQLLGLGLQLVGSSRMPEFGLNASTEFVDAEPTKVGAPLINPVGSVGVLRCLVGRIRGVGGSGCGPDRPRERRRWIDPHPVRRVRARRAQADAGEDRPQRPGHADADQPGQ